MDDGEGHRKQHAVPTYPGVPPLGSTGEVGGRPGGRGGAAAAGAGGDRSRQVSMLAGHGHGPASSATTIPGAGGAPGYGYYEDAGHPGSVPVPPGALPYQSEYAPEQRQHQPLPQYGPGMVYGLSQQQLSHNPPSSYDPPVLPYQQQQQQPRRPAGMEVLPGQFTTVPPFYVPHEPIGTSAPALQGPLSLSSMGLAPQGNTGGRSSLAQAYPSAMSDLSPSGAGPAPAAAAAAAAPAATPTTSAEYGQAAAAAAAAAASPNYDAAYQWYQTSLKRIFEQVHSGQLADAGQTLLDISEWLLTRAAELGLVRDAEELHGDRLRLWNEFNVGWLSTLQKQKEMTQTVLRTGQRPAPPQTLLTEDFLEKMGQELVRLCDGMEPHGLVDYEMGVWEEEIIDVLEDCLQLTKRVEDMNRPQATGSGTHPAPHTQDTTAVTVQTVA